MKKINYKILLLSSFLTCSSFSEEAKVIQIGTENCKKKEYLIKETPFKIDLFCEGALGAYIGIVYRDVMGSAEAESKWKTDERYWQIKNWSSDVRSFIIVKSNSQMIISTSGIYGEAGIYQLYLNDKKWKRLFYEKGNGENAYVIKKFNEQTSTLEFYDEISTDKKTLILKIK